MASYCIFIKNKRDRGFWYLRKSDHGKVTDVNLKTHDRKEAEVQLMKVKVAQAELDRQNASGEALNALDVRQKELRSPVDLPGGVLDIWTDRLKVEGYREQSISRYLRAAQWLLRGVNIADLTADKVAEIFATKTVKLKSTTRHGYVNALNNLFDHFGRDDLKKGLPKVKVEPPTKSTWTREQMYDIIMNVRSNTAERTEQYRLYFSVMAIIGSRPGETYDLLWSDLNEDTGIIHFRAEIVKTRRERFCPLPFSLWAQLETIRGEPDQRIFSACSPCQASRFTVLSNAIKRAGVPKGGLKTFRTSVSNILYRKSGDIVKVSQLLGHGPGTAMTWYQSVRAPEELADLVNDEVIP
ncbi:site-specific integrase [Fibrobacter sp. UWP2]|uniref:tyrosine-type recombinase/integrase n=1 Tax=Fibrobacter sp. UWP2 TaxID=1896216 RepID=UPI000910CB07|nr:site-specific integrase [Fibrobacter sp. UWP2]SHI34708.1 Integrase [Fibrobacter sp. UWP2]